MVLILSMKTVFIILVLIIISQRHLDCGLKFNVLNHSKAHSNVNIMRALVVLGLNLRPSIKWLYLHQALRIFI